MMELENRRHPVHATGAKNIDAVVRFASCVPVMLPALGDRIHVESFVERIDGLVLTGGRANVEPWHYDGPPFPDDEPIDPERDATTLAMVRACVAAEVPVFGICRGIQEMNVALGGSLHYRLHLLEDKDDHRMPQRDDVTVEEIFEPRHSVRLTRGGRSRRSLPTGSSRGVRLKNDGTFTVGVQWHAEWKPEEHELSRKLFEEFGRAARARARRRPHVDLKAFERMHGPAHRTTHHRQAEPLPSRTGSIQGRLYRRAGRRARGRGGHPRRGHRRCAAQERRGPVARSPSGSRCGQWHAEWRPEEHELSRKLFEEFGDAARARARRRPHVDFSAFERMPRAGADRAGASKLDRTTHHRQAEPLPSRAGSIQGRL